MVSATYYIKELELNIYLSCDAKSSNPKLNMYFKKSEQISVSLVAFFMTGFVLGYKVMLYDTIIFDVMHCNRVPFHTFCFFLLVKYMSGVRVLVRKHSFVLLHTQILWLTVKLKEKMSGENVLYL